jgi:hypothetical protein
MKYQFIKIDGDKIHVLSQDNPHEIIKEIVHAVFGTSDHTYKKGEWVDVSVNLLHMHGDVHLRTNFIPPKHADHYIGHRAISKFWGLQIETRHPSTPYTYIRRSSRMSKASILHIATIQKKVQQVQQIFDREMKEKQIFAEMQEAIAKDMASLKRAIGLQEGDTIAPTGTRYRLILVLERDEVKQVYNLVRHVLGF